MLRSVALSCPVAQSGRIDFRLRNAFHPFAPAVKHFGVVPAGDSPRSAPPGRHSPARCLFKRYRDMRRFRPAAIDAAHEFGFAGQRRLPRANPTLGPKKAIGSSGLRGQRLGGIILRCRPGINGFSPFLTFSAFHASGIASWLVPEPTIIFSPAISSALSNLDTPADWVLLTRRSPARSLR